MADIRIVGVERMSLNEIVDEVERGGKFVIYQTVMSFLVITMKNPTAIHFIKAGHGRVGPGIGYTIQTFLLGWWGFPWGFIYTPAVLITNLCGGKDVTQAVMSDLVAHAERQANRARLAQQKNAGAPT
jgi:hypothetical protein